MSDIKGDSDFLSETSSDDDDDEMFLNEPRVRNENYLEETVPQYTNKEFFEHFRISREIVINISAMYEQSDNYNNKNGHYGNISSLNQVIIFLWYIGHETSSFRDVADRFGISESSVSRILYRVTNFLSNLSPMIIKWPSEEEKRISAEHFRESGFPNVIGAIDGCHIKIDKPSIDPESYINRKGYYSIQLQVVCDHKRKIIDLFLGYPGSVHDSRVFRNSQLGNNLENKCGRYYILGDSGYPIRHQLLTPYKDRGNLSRRQQNYNLKLSKNRYVSEHCFSILKQKFRQLYHIKLRNIRFIAHLIRAACILHNIAIEDNFEVNEDNVEDIAVLNDEQNADSDEENMDANNIRNNIANSLPM